MPEETPAQRRLRKGTAGRVAGFRDRMRKPPAPPITTRPTQPDVEAGDTPSPSPAQPGSSHFDEPRRDNKDDGDQAPRFVVPNPGSSANVVKSRDDLFSRFGGSGAVSSTSSRVDQGACVLGVRVAPRGGSGSVEGEGLEKLGLGCPVASFGGQVFGSTASPGIQVKGAAGGVASSSGFGGFPTGPFTGKREVNAGVTTSHQQTIGAHFTPWTSLQHTTQPPAIPWGTRTTGFGESRSGEQRFAPSTTWGAERSALGEQKSRGDDIPYRNQDEDLEISDAQPDLDGDTDLLGEEAKTDIQEPRGSEAPATATRWIAGLSQGPAPAAFVPQDSTYEEFNKQEEIRLKEEAKRKLQARLKTAEAPNMPPQIHTGISILGQFLVAINGFIAADNEAGITDYMVIEPPYSDMYNRLISELQQNYPKGSEDALEEKCRQGLSHARDGVKGSPSWSQFIRLMAQYLAFLRDVDMDQSKYLETYDLLTELQRKANSALNHAQLGHLVLGTVVSCAKAVCRLAIGLDKQPHLIAHLKSAQISEGSGESEALTLPERAVDIIRSALSHCIADKSSKVTKDGKIEGKQRGTYTLANTCLRIFFQCRKTRNATLVFQSIGSTTIPLSAYSKRERVTYLYYLGRFWFQNNHFPRARLALQQAYDECSARDHSIRQRRYILVFLIASNLIVGRFPSQAIFQRPEARGLHERFFPLMQAIRSGNIALFRQHMSFDSAHADWFLHFRILLQLKNRCEVLVWRSLVRKIWILNGTRYDPNNARVPVTFDLDDLVVAFSALEKQSRLSDNAAYIDPDFDAAEDHADEEQLPDLRRIESLIASLVDQGLLKGFIAHRQRKFSIMGVRLAAGDVLAAGFPQPWKVLEQKIDEDEGSGEVPGWKQGAPGSLMTGGAMGAGKVVNLSGLRQIGQA